MLMLSPCCRSFVRSWRGARCLHTTARMAKRNYADAIQALNSLQTNFAVLDAIRASGRKMNSDAIPEMIEWCRRAGFDPSDLNRLNAIHVAGTKGKGSTSAFVSSILQQYQQAGQQDEGVNGGKKLAPTKLGLYTSPHLRFVRERIQLDGKPIAEQDFADAFFAVWDQLEKSAAEKPIAEDEPQKPVYFRFLTLMAFHAYLAKGVDTAVIECGVGGEYDSTNVLLNPSVTGITSLGIDHTSVLGPTIEDIAWHKAGIMKKGAPAFTAPQPSGALDVLRKRATEKGVELQVVDLHPEIASGRARLGLEGEFQKGNASLAVALAAAHLKSMGHDEINTQTLNDKFLKGLASVQWGGRCETREEPETGILWHIDGAHTLESMEAASQWFATRVQQQQQQQQQQQNSSSTSSPSSTTPLRILLFNQQQRAGRPLLSTLNSTVSAQTGLQQPFQHAIFSSNVTFASSGYRPDLVNANASGAEVDRLAVQHGFADSWREIDPQTQVVVTPTIEEAVGEVRRLAREVGAGAGVGEGKYGVQVLAVGSVHLIGGLMEVLETGTK